MKPWIGGDTACDIKWINKGGHTIMIIHEHTAVTLSGSPKRPLASLLLKNLQSDSNVSPRDAAFFSSITWSTIDNKWFRLVCESGKKISAPATARTSKVISSTQKFMFGNTLTQKKKKKKKKTNKDLSICYSYSWSNWETTLALE